MIGRILVVEDEKDMALLLRRIISEETAHEVVTETDPVKAMSLFKDQAFDLVLTDLKMPQMDGLEVLKEVKKIKPETAVVIMTAYATIDTAVTAIRNGAYDYVTKPFRRDRILLTVDKVMERMRMIRENEALRQALGGEAALSYMVGSTSIMKGILERIRQVAPTMATVLITGPSGTGKELAARAIHQNSLRSASKLVTVSCTAIPENVLESELFGHVKGAFTGAWRDKKGLVEEADGGTLFLDEIGDLSPVMQTKLLRLLQEGEFKPVGSVVTRKADVRFIAATNHNLKADVKDNLFREDLYYRLNVIHVELPPLKTRKADIPLLAYHFLKKYAGLNQKEIHSISPAAMQALAAFDYPGNIRELENIIERGVIFCTGDTLKAADLQIDVEEDGVFPTITQDVSSLPFREAKEKMLQKFYRHYIESLLRESGGNISKAAEMAEIQRQYLHRLMKEAGISADEFRDQPE